MLDFSRVGDWIISETSFDPSALGKVEANFCLSNGYLGLRSATEERYPLETRDLLVAGTFDQFSPRGGHRASERSRCDEHRADAGRRAL